MTNEEVIETINEFLIDEFEVDGAEISPEAPLKETLDLLVLKNQSMLKELTLTSTKKMNSYQSQIK